MQEGLHLEVYEYSVKSLQHRLSLYLYRNVNKKIRPALYRKNCLWTLMCEKNKHTIKRTEKKYGEIMMMISVCTSCGYGFGEVFPVRRVPEKVIIDGV